MYVIVSKPAAAGDAQTFEFGSIDQQVVDQFVAFVAGMLPNATMEDLRCPQSGVRVTAEPVRRFDFSHLERLL